MGLPAPSHARLQPPRKADRQRLGGILERRPSRRMPEHHGFRSLDGARQKIEAWREHHSESRPHTALRYVPPREFVQQRGGMPPREPGFFSLRSRNPVQNLVRASLNANGPS